jgi:hypothetical protein
MTGTDYGLFTHNQSRSYLNHLVFGVGLLVTEMDGRLCPEQTTTKVKNKLTIRRLIVIENCGKKTSVSSARPRL